MAGEQLRNRWMIALAAVVMQICLGAAYVGRAPVFFMLFAIEAVILFLLPRVHSVTVFSIMFALIGLCYGGGFGTMPSFAADFFGPKYMGGIYGWILLAWGLGAVPSPILIARVRQNTGAYGPAIYTIAIVMVCALMLPILARYRPAPPVATESTRDERLPRAA